MLGRAARGSTRWIDVGFFTFQPSEFGKLLFVLAIAGFLAERARAGGDVAHDDARARARRRFPIVLVFAQPDLGTALVYMAALGAMLFVCRHAVEAALAISACSACSCSSACCGRGRRSASTSSRRTRSSASPASCIRDVPRRRALQPRAVDRRRRLGRGDGPRRPTNATQTRLNFLPEHHTDFVFASFSEQRGFVGASILLALYLLVAVARRCASSPSRETSTRAIAAGGIVLALLFQIFVNVGMTMGIAPITGIPLPFVSVGGSSMIANLAAMGVLLAIHARGRASRASAAADGAARSRSARCAGS